MHVNVSQPTQNKQKKPQRKRVLGHILATSGIILGSFFAGALSSSVARARAGDESPLAVVEQLARVLTIVENEYVDPVERDRLLSGAIKGMVAELDPHSSYFPADENALFRADTEGKFGGVGLEVELRDDRIIVISPMEGSPAERAGIHRGDRIVAVGPDSTKGVPLERLVRKMRGDPGTKVEITVLGPNEDRPRTLVLTREIIRVVSVVGQRLAGDIAYVRIRQFQGNTHEELLRLIGKLRAASPAPLTGVLLDLRNNPGGLVDQATGVADEFLDGGVIFSTRHRGKIVEEIKASRGGALVDLPLAVLVNEFSASASELVAAALQDPGRGRLFGATTFGKGSVQSILDLPGGAGMKITTMRYYTPLGRVIQAAGVTPDVRVEQPDLPAGHVPREGELEGALPADDGLGPRKPTAPRPTNSAPAASAPRPATSAAPAASGSASPPDKGIDDQSEYGVIKKVPDDPIGGPDRALSAAYSYVLARIRGKP
jgi:carboxyl-terminal processing protease